MFTGKDQRTGEDVAIKRTHIGHFGSTAARASAFSEIEILSYMDHPNVIKLIAAYQCPTDIHMVMRKVHGYHLIRYLVVIEKEEAAGRSHAEIEEEKMSLLHQLVDAVAHVHSRGVVYRDLKPANVMVSEVGGDTIDTSIHPSTYPSIHSTPGAGVLGYV